jgi:hypothetical protein
MSDNTTADQAVSNVKLAASAAWAWLVRHPAVIAVLFFLIGFLLG